MKQNNISNDDSLDLKDLFLSLIAQWKIIALCIILSLICALLYLRVTTPVFSADALVQVEDAKSGGAAALLANLGGAIPEGFGGKSPADAEIQILNSRLILGKVIQDLRLDLNIKNNKNTVFNRILQENTDQVIYKNNLVIFKSEQGELVLSKFDIPKFYLDQNLEINFTHQDKFTISYEDQILLNGSVNQLNSKVDKYGRWNIQIFSNTHFKDGFTIRKLSLPSAVTFVQSQYGVSERGKSSGILSLNYTGTDKDHITTVLNRILNEYQTRTIERKTMESKQTLSFLDKQLPELKSQLETSEIKFNQFREQYNTIDVTQEAELMLKQNVELAKMKIELQQQQAELASKYTGDHPLMAAVNAQLAEINQKTSEMTQNIKKLPETQRLYLQLYRDVKVNTELYTALLNSYQQLKIVQAGEIGNVRIIDYAVEPVKPIKPRSLIILVLSIFVGGFVGLLIALLRKMTQSGIKDASQIENEFDLPVYATVPRSPMQESRISIIKKKKSIPILAIKNSEDIAIESLRSIRTAIHFALTSAKNNIISISGPAPEVGKSFISINLATIFSQSNKRVLLLDLDLRRGYLHKYFDQDANPGLTEVMSGNIALEQAIYDTGIPNLHYLARGKSPANPSEMLSSQQFKDLLDKLSSQYDHIIMDTPPILAVTDGIILSQYSGINLIVARYAKTQVKELELTIAKFEQAGTKVNGVILNDVNAAIGGNGYNYAYAYNAAKDND